MSVYRLPFRTAQRKATPLEWQPQPLWAFDASLAFWEWQTYVATFSLGIPCTKAAWEWQTYLATVTVAGDINIDCSLAQWEWTTYRAQQDSSVQIACTRPQWEWTVYSSDIDSTPLTIQVGGIRANVAQNSISAKISQNRITARVA